MPKPTLPKTERAVIAAHEAGMHDRKPIPATCRECAKAASTDGVEAAPAPEPVKRPAPKKPAPKRRIIQHDVAREPLKVEKFIEAIDKSESEAVRVTVEETADGPKVIDVQPVYTSRESWLIAAVEELKPLFEAAEAPVVPVRVSVGWPAGRSAKGNTIGQCFQSPLVADGVPNIFISPVLTDPVRVLDVLVHELVHSIVPVAAAPHRGAFVKLAKAVGLEGPWTATKAGEELTAYLKGIADKLGPFTHAAVSKGGGRKVQTTRMLKVECTDCGCVIRMTAKWVKDAGLPTCGCGGEMEMPA